jgi:parvulin-like peptidyl-prolyl isomerase
MKRKSRTPAGSRGLAFIALAASLVAWAGCASDRPEAQPVAKVGDATLTRDALQKRMALEGLSPDREAEFIERWVNRELLVQEAKRRGFGKSEALKLELENVEKQVLINQMVEREFAGRIQITDAEVQEYYDKNKPDFQVDEEEVHLFDLQTKSQAEAEGALQEIRAGKSFEQVARDRSTGAFRETGGDLGFVRKNELPVELSRIAFVLPEGGVSGALKSGEGFHVLKAQKKRGKGSTKDLNDVKAEILERLRVNKERAVYYDLLYDLKAKSTVFIAPTSGSGTDESIGAKGR